MPNCIAYATSDLSDRLCEQKELLDLRTGKAFEELVRVMRVPFLTKIRRRIAQGQTKDGRIAIREVLKACKHVREAIGKPMRPESLATVADLDAIQRIENNQAQIPCEDLNRVTQVIHCVQPQTKAAKLAEVRTLL